jgi:hypothetical protein
VVRAQGLNGYYQPVPWLLAAVAVPALVLYRFAAWGLGALFGSQALADSGRRLIEGLVSGRQPVLGIELAVLAALLTWPLVVVPRASRTVRRQLRSWSRSPSARVGEALLRLAVSVLGLVVPALLGVIIGAAAGALVWLATDADTGRRAAFVAAVLTAAVLVPAGLSQAWSQHTYSQWQQAYWRRHELSADEQEDYAYLRPPRMLSLLRPVEADRGLLGRRAQRNWAAGSEQFLRWAYDAGVVRAGGLGFQFRHRELEDWCLSTLRLEDDRPDDWVREILLPQSDHESLDKLAARRRSLARGVPRELASHPVGTSADVRG